MKKQFERHGEETWREVIVRLTSHHAQEEEILWDGSAVMVSLTDKLLKKFDDVMLRDPSGDARHAALTALHFWGGLPRTEHTPGPWTWAMMDESTTMLLGDGQDPCCTSILIAEGCKACADKGRNCSINGNQLDLTLIAAAPDLLAACKALVESGRTPRNTEEFCAAVEAIAKAEGR